MTSVHRGGPGSKTSPDRTETAVTERVQGPASYFPAIEKRYGRPVADFPEVIDLEDIIASYDDYLEAMATD